MMMPDRLLEGAMMKKKQTKRLELNKETVAMLEQRDLVKAVAGNSYPVCISFNPATESCCDWH